MLRRPGNSLTGEFSVFVLVRPHQLGSWAVTEGMVQWMLSKPHGHDPRTKLANLIEKRSLTNV